MRRQRGASRDHENPLQAFTDNAASSQLMNYLRLTGSNLGLLVNFGAYPKVVVEQWAN